MGQTSPFLALHLALKLLPEHCITAQIIELKITVVTTKMQITRQVYLFSGCGAQ